MIRGYCQFCGERIVDYDQECLVMVAKGKHSCAFLCNTCCDVIHQKCGHNCELCKKSTEVMRGILKGKYSAYTSSDTITIMPIDSSIILQDHLEDALFDDDADDAEAIEIDWDEEEPDLFDPEDWERC